MAVEQAHLTEDVALHERADGDLAITAVTGAVVVAAVNAGLWAVCHWMFKSGYKLKA